MIGRLGLYSQGVRVPHAVSFGMGYLAMSHAFDGSFFAQLACAASLCAWWQLRKQQTLELPRGSTSRYSCL
jgi:hypothetical protein